MTPSLKRFQADNGGRDETPPAVLQRRTQRTDNAGTVESEPGKQDDNTHLLM